MATRADDIRVYIGGEDRALDRELKKAQGLIQKFARTGERTLGGFTGALTRQARRVFSFHGAIATLAGSAGLGLLIKSSVESAAAISDTADQIGIGVEALQEYRYAARQAGIEQNVLEQSLRAMVRRQGEAINGNKEFARGFTAVGISIGELRTLKPEEVLDRVADGLARIPEQAQRIAAADRIFSETGRRLITLFGGGAEGLRKMRQEARELGIVLDSVMVREAKRASDELERVGSILSTNVTRAVLALTPQIIALAEALTKRLRPIVSWLIESLPDATASSDELRRRIAEVRAEIDRLAAQGTRTGLNDLGDVLSRILTGRRPRSDDLAALRSRLAELEAALAARLRKEALLKAAIEGRSDADKQGADTTRLSAKALEIATQAATDEAMANQRAREAAVERGKAIIATARDSQRAIADELTLAKRQLELAGRSDPVFEAELRVTRAIIDARREGLPLLDEETAALRAKALEIARTSEAARRLDRDSRDMGDSFAAAAESIIMQSGDIGDALKNLALDFERIILRRAVLQPLADAVSTGASSFFTSLFHEGGRVGSGQGHARLVSPLAFAGAARMHGGGIAGDEVPIIAKRGERVVPAGAAGGGQVIINLIDRRGADAPAVGASSRTTPRGDTVVDLVINAVNDGIGRGRFDSALGASFNLRRTGAR